MGCLNVLCACLLLSLLSNVPASAQIPPPLIPCTFETDSPYATPAPSCPAGGKIPLPQGFFQATAFVDANCSPTCPLYGDVDQNVVSLYGSYGNDESAVGNPGHGHYTTGVNLVQNIQPLCRNGLPP